MVQAAQSRPARMHPPSRSDVAAAPAAQPTSSTRESEVGHVVPPADEVDQNVVTNASLAELLAAERERSDRDEITLERQRATFDFALKQRAELEREMNALSALSMQQMKHDDEILKEWIRLV